MRVILEIPDEEVEIIKRNGFNKDGTFSFKLNEVVKQAIRNGVILPDNATNGDMIKAMLQVVGYTPLSAWSEEKRKKSGFRVHIKDVHNCDFSLTVSEDWWKAPYKRGKG